MPFKTGDWGDQAKARYEKRKQYWVNRRAKAISALGGECVRCGFKDKRALQIDHINGNGCRERGSTKKSGNYIATRDILNGNIEKYQLLCANCNWIKRFENNEHSKNEVK